MNTVNLSSAVPGAIPDPLQPTPAPVELPVTPDPAVQEPPTEAPPERDPLPDTPPVEAPPAAPPQ